MEADVQGKRVLVRAGLDVPIEDGKITDLSRIEAMVPTMRHILDHGGSVVIMAHQGRPKGKVVPEESQRPLADPLQNLLTTNVHFLEACTGPETTAFCATLKTGDVVLLENLRFDAREEANDPAFAAELAALGDLYVNDAFTNSHREHASMVGVPKLLPSFMGLQLQLEVEHLSLATHEPRRPLALIVSGAKMETKVPVIRAFLERGDDVLLGGAIANTFLLAQGSPVGSSLVQQDEVPVAQEILAESHQPGRACIHVPIDAIAAPSLQDFANAAPVQVVDLPADRAIFDVGPETVAQYCAVIAAAKTIVWNGPLGCYETPAFAGATKAIAEAILAATKNESVSIIGGGDTLDAHARFGIPLSGYTFASTAGGAMLEFIAQGTLPAIDALQR